MVPKKTFAVNISNIVENFGNFGASTSGSAPRQGPSFPEPLLSKVGFSRKDAAEQCRPWRLSDVKGQK